MCIIDDVDLDESEKRDNEATIQILHSTGRPYSGHAAGRERDALAARRCITTRSSVALDGRRLPKEAVGVCQRGVPVLEQPTS